MKLNLATITAILATSLLLLIALSLACGQAQATPTVAPGPNPTATATAAPRATPTAVAAAATPTVPAVTRPVRGGTLRSPLSVTIDAPDPAYTFAHGVKNVLYMVYNGIVKQMPDGTIGPDLAKSWEFSADGKTITFRLQEGVKFHDGTALDAQAVKANYDRFLDPAVGAARRTELSPPLQRVEVVDSTTVRFQLASAFRPLLATLTLQAGLMASPTAVQKTNSYADRTGDFGRKPVGSGPFKLQEWVPGDRFTLVRNDAYWEKDMPYMDGVSMPIIGDVLIHFAMLRTGEADFIERVRPEDVELASRNAQVRVVEQKGVNTQMLYFRSNVKPWDNKALRQAFGYAIDRDAIVKTVFAGKAVPAQSVVGPVLGQWHDTTIQVFKYDTQKAKQLLAQAGYPNGFSFRMPCRTSGGDAATCDVLQAVLANSGINMEIQPYENVAYFSDFVAKKHDGPMASWWGPRPDPGVLIRLLYHSKGSQNYWGYSNADVDKWVEEADSVYDLAKAKALYNKALTQITDDASTVQLAWWNIYYGMRDSVRNFAPVPDGVPRLAGIWVAK